MTASPKQAPPKTSSAPRGEKTSVNPRSVPYSGRFEKQEHDVQNVRLLAEGNIWKGSCLAKP